MKRLKKLIFKLVFFLTVTFCIGWLYVRSINEGVSPDSFITLFLAVAIWALVIIGFVWGKGTPLTIGLLTLVVPLFLPIKLLYMFVPWFWVTFKAIKWLAGVDLSRLWELKDLMPMSVAQMPFLGWAVWLLAVTVLTTSGLIFGYFLRRAKIKTTEEKNGEDRKESNQEGQSTLTI